MRGKITCLLYCNSSRSLTFVCVLVCVFKANNKETSRVSLIANSINKSYNRMK